MTLKFYTAWFCPYAHRAHITLEHLKLPYEKIEAYDGTNKDPRLLELNPKGQVPTIEFSPEQIKDSTTLQNDHDWESLQQVKDAWVLTESLTCVELLNALSMEKKDSSSSLDLLAKPSFKAAATEFNSKICSKFYRILANPTEEERKNAYASFVQGIVDFLSHVQEEGFYQSKTLTIVDIAVIPTLLRICVLDHFRPSYKLSEFMDQDCWTKFTGYMDRIKSLPAVQKSMFEDENAMIEKGKKFVA
jgi:glutathione S-transferase